MISIPILIQLISPIKEPLDAQKTFFIVFVLLDTLMFLYCNVASYYILYRLNASEERTRFILPLQIELWRLMKYANNIAYI